MKPRTTIVRRINLVVLAALPLPARAQDAKDPYPTMAPLEQYLIADRETEIALARSAGPARLRHCGERQERFCLCSAAFMDGRTRRYRLLESEATRANLL